MGTTATAALPYPEPTDPVADGAAAIEALAEAVDPQLTWGVIGGTTRTGLRVIGGQTTVTTSGAGALAVPFNPTFALTPVCGVNIMRTDVGAWSNVYVVDTVHFEAIVFDSNGATVPNLTTTVQWWAIGFI
jgi:hypothetical protein